MSDEYRAYVNYLDYIRRMAGIKDAAIADGGRLKAVEIAREMLKDGITPAAVSKYTGLTMEEIEGLKDS